MYAANGEHAPQASTTRYPLSRESLPISILCEITLMKSGVESYDLVSYLISVYVLCTVKDS
jgi:hypothetical protein